MSRFTVPNGTAFPAKTHEYGRRTRYEVRRSTDEGKGSVRVESDNPTRAGRAWAFDTVELAQTQCNRINNATGGDVANERYKILDYTVRGETFTNHVRVYLLNAGDKFNGFGGSGQGIIARGTASLVIRECDGNMTRDSEHHVNSENAWAVIERGLLLSHGIEVKA